MHISDFTSSTVFTPDNPFPCIASGVYTKESKKGPYIGGEFSDGKQSIPFKIWSDNYAALQSVVTNGAAINVLNGATSEWNGELQLTCLHAEPLTFEQVKEYELIPTSETSKENLLERFDTLVSAYVKDTPLLELIDIVKGSKIWDLYTQIPAARSNHHNYIHGLLEHSINTADLALALLHRQRGPYEADLSVTVTAALFHDIGKIKEYTFSPLGLCEEYSSMGTQLGHLFIGASLLRNLANQNKIKGPLIDHMSHIILSHHGWVSNGWGSVADPRSIEAFAVAHADEMDAAMNSIYMEIGNAAPGKPVYVKSVGGKYFHIM